MGQHEDKVDILTKYYTDVIDLFRFYVGKNVPKKNIENARKKFARGVEDETVIGFYDTTVSSSGRQGFLFTDDKVYFLEVLEKPQKLWYDDIKSMEILDTHKKDSERKLKFNLYDGSSVTWNSIGMNKTPMYNFFTDIIGYINHSQSYGNTDPDFEEFKYRDVESPGAVAGGVGIGNYGSVNKLYDEENFHAYQGHGFAAERANDLYDELTGHKVVRNAGADNKKDGFDRIVDGVQIQTKYCRTGKECIDACFDDSGKFRYFNTENGKPMQIEVPSDKYEAAVQAMEDKIKNGQVEGVSDPKAAKDIVRKGHFTYEQAKNIAKAGTVESITYDAVNGAIIAGSAFGITAVLTFATSVWGGEDFDVALKNSVYSGLKVGGTAFITTVLASQLSKAGLNSALVGSSEAVIAFMGPKASAVLVNAFRSGKNIYGAAAMKSAAKLLRGNVIIAGVSFVVLSSVDIANIFQGRISGKQLFKNMANTAAAVGGGTAGWLGGAAIGSAIFPGVGTVVGGLIGSVAAGGVASKTTDFVVGKFIEDDAEEMVRIIQKVFEELASDYLLNKKEAEKIIDKLSKELTGKKLKDMFACKNRKVFARNMLIPMIEKEIKYRKHISVPTDKQMMEGLKMVLEEIADDTMLATT